MIGTYYLRWHLKTSDLDPPLSLVVEAVMVMITEKLGESETDAVLQTFLFIFFLFVSSAGKHCSISLIFDRPALHFPEIAPYCCSTASQYQEK